MQLLLVRHGEAVDRRSAANDHDRWLTKSGRRTVTKVGRALAQRDLQYSCIYTSPLVRAVQTAEILAGTHPHFHGPLKVAPALSIDAGSTEEALEPLEHGSDDDLIIMVTHMPKISVLAGHLCKHARDLSFRTASACLLTVERGKGRIEWMLDPETLQFHQH
jgi:phosphohistidine phosphatase